MEDVKVGVLIAAIQCVCVDLVGFPNATAETIVATLEAHKAAGLDTISVPVPETSYYI